MTGEWISVDERLPEIDADVLTFADVEDFDGPRCDLIEIGWLMKIGAWRIGALTVALKPLNPAYVTVNGTHRRLRVTHWMPLPEPPSDAD